MQTEDLLLRHQVVDRQYGPPAPLEVSSPTTSLSWWPLTPPWAFCTANRAVTPCWAPLKFGAASPVFEVTSPIEIGAAEPLVEPEPAGVEPDDDVLGAADVLGAEDLLPDQHAATPTSTVAANSVLKVRPLFM